MNETNIQVQLNETQQQNCDGIIVLNELTESINKLKLNKSPGKDGLTVELYRTFREKIKNTVLNCAMSHMKMVN